MADASREVREMQFRKIKADPASFYTDPDEVVSDGRFNTEQKLGILAQWGNDVIRLDPGAAIAEDPLSHRAVKRIARAIEALGGDPGEMLTAVS